MALGGWNEDGDGLLVLDRVVQRLAEPLLSWGSQEQVLGLGLSLGCIVVMQGRYLLGG